MSQFAIKVGRIITPLRDFRDGIIIVNGEKIEYVGCQASIGSPEGIEVIDAGDSIAAPGSLDLHHHGALGVSAADGMEAVLRIAAFLPSTGCTSWLPTVGQKGHVRGIISAKRHGSQGADIPGIHMEGPFLAPVELPGDPESDAHLERPSLGLLHEIQEEAEGLVRLVGVGIEMDGALELIREIVKMGMVASVAHTKAGYERFIEAVDAGIRHATHVYNNMTGMHHRKPGVVGGVLTCDQVTGELIADGYHVSPPAMEVLIRCKGTDRVALITDNTLAGFPDGRYERPGRHAVIKKNGTVRLEGYDGNTDHTLSGSVWTIDHNIRTVVETVGVSLKDAIKMASLVPARIVGLDGSKGSLEPGKDADIVIANDCYRVKMTFVKGRKVFCSDHASDSDNCLEKVPQE